MPTVCYNVRETVVGGAALGTWNLCPLSGRLSLFDSGWLVLFYLKNGARVCQCCQFFKITKMFWIFVRYACEAIIAKIIIKKESSPFSSQGDPRRDQD